MTTVEIILISISLAMDAFAVSLATSMVSKANDKKIYLIPIVFAIFQIIMPCIGFATVGIFIDSISKYANVVVFVILFVIGIMMLKEGLLQINNPQRDIKKLSIGFILVQGIATSIDALAIGAGFRTIQVNMLSAVLMIGLITLVMCSIAIIIGKKVSDGLGGKAEILGGIILCIIAIKTLGFKIAG